MCFVQHYVNEGRQILEGYSHYFDDVTVSRSVFSKGLSLFSLELINTLFVHDNIFFILFFNLFQVDMLKPSVHETLRTELERLEVDFKVRYLGFFKIQNVLQIFALSIYGIYRFKKNINDIGKMRQPSEKSLRPKSSRNPPSGAMRGDGHFCGAEEQDNEQEATTRISK